MKKIDGKVMLEKGRKYGRSKEGKENVSSFILEGSSNI
jgi:hypothetical protein